MIRRFLYVTVALVAIVLLVRPPEAPGPGPSPTPRAPTARASASASVVAPGLPARLRAAIRATIAPLLAQASSAGPGTAAARALDPAWRDRARKALADRELVSLSSLFEKRRDEFFGPSALPAEEKRSLYLAIQDLWQVRCSLAASEGATAPATCTLLSPLYGPTTAAASAAGTILLPFCGHEPRDRIAPPWIRLNLGQPAPPHLAADGDGPAPRQEWYAPLFTRRMREPRVRLVDAISSDDPDHWSPGRAWTSPPLMVTGAGPADRVEIMTAVSGLGPDDRLVMTVGQDARTPVDVATIRDPTGLSASRPLEACHTIDPRLVPRPPFVLGVRFERGPASRGPAPKVGFVAFRTRG